jgi:hypothetical protein
VNARTPRKRRARPPVVTQPILVTQLNSLSLVGIDARRFLELVRDREIPHGRAGKLVLVDVNLLRDVLLDSSIAPDGGDDDGEVAGVDEGDDPRDVDDVLGVIGRRARR